MIVALRSGVPADHWLDDPRALVTALEIFDKHDREAKAKRPRRRR